MDTTFCYDTINDAIKKNSGENETNQFIDYFANDELNNTCVKINEVQSNAEMNDNLETTPNLENAPNFENAPLIIQVISEPQSIVFQEEKAVNCSVLSETYSESNISSEPVIIESKSDINCDTDSFVQIEQSVQEELSGSKNTSPEKSELPVTTSQLSETPKIQANIVEQEIEMENKENVDINNQQYGKTPIRHEPKPIIYQNILSSTAGQALNEFEITPLRKYDPCAGVAGLIPEKAATANDPAKKLASPCPEATLNPPVVENKTEPFYGLLGLVSGTLQQLLPETSPTPKQIDEETQQLNKEEISEEVQKELQCQGAVKEAQDEKIVKVEEKLEVNSAGEGDLIHRSDEKHAENVEITDELGSVIPEGHAEQVEITGELESVLPEGHAEQVDITGELESVVQNEPPTLSPVISPIHLPLKKKLCQPIGRPVKRAQEKCEIQSQDHQSKTDLIRTPLVPIQSTSRGFVSDVKPSPFHEVQKSPDKTNTFRGELRPILSSRVNESYAGPPTNEDTWKNYKGPQMEQPTKREQFNTPSKGELHSKSLPEMMELFKPDIMLTPTKQNVLQQHLYGIDGEKWALQQEIAQLKLQLNTSQQVSTNLEFKLHQGNDAVMDLQNKLYKSANELLYQKKENEKMTAFCGEYEMRLKNYYGQYEKARAYNEDILKNYRILELAFNDLNEKYVRAKEIIEGYIANEETLKENAARLQQTIQAESERYAALKKNSSAQIEKLIETNEATQEDCDRLEVQVKHFEIKLGALNSSLEQKTNECMNLAQLLDKLSGRKV